jgi:hypothetical protein
MAFFYSLHLACFIQVELNSETLRSAIVYMIADSDLPFAFVERKSFRDLVRLLNQDAVALINTTNQKSIATHVTRMYDQSEKTIRNNYIKKQISISFTQDAWTAPNVTAFMAVTAHFIDENFQMRDLTLAVPHVEGELVLFTLASPLSFN